MEELLAYLARELVDHPGRGPGRAPRRRARRGARALRRGGRRRQGDRQAGQRRPRASDDRPGVGGQDRPPRACRDRRLRRPGAPSGSSWEESAGRTASTAPSTSTATAASCRFGPAPSSRSADGRGDPRAARHGRAPDPAPRPGERPRRRRGPAWPGAQRPVGGAAGHRGRRVLPRRPDRLLGALRRAASSARCTTSSPTRRTTSSRSGPADGSEPLLIPFAEDVVTAVDVSERVVTIREDFL